MAEWFTLRVGETVTSKHADFSVKFVDVIDSRCPEGRNTVCVWQGIAQMTLTVRAGKRSEAITLFSSGHAEYPSFQTIFGRTINVVDIQPWPHEDVRFDARNYVLRLSISDDNWEKNKRLP